MSELHEGTLIESGTHCDNGACWCWKKPELPASKVVSIQDGMFICTDGAGYFSRPATDDEKLFWAEVVRLRTEREADLVRMERAAEAIEKLTERVNELRALGQAAANRADDAGRRAGETPAEHPTSRAFRELADSHEAQGFNDMIGFTPTALRRFADQIDAVASGKTPCSGEPT